MSRRSKRRSGRPRSLRRRHPFRRERRTFLVFCEGAKTEPEYLDALKREPAVKDVASVQIKINKAKRGSPPLTLVKAAAEARVRSRKEEGEVDQVWCLFDTDWPNEHPNLQEAESLAAKEAVHLAVSNPCFELWLILHFEECRGPLQNKEADRRRKKIDGSPNKGLGKADYMGNRTKAARRARDLDAMHKSNGNTFPRDNPSSGMYRFLEALENTQVP